MPDEKQKPVKTLREDRKKRKTWVWEPVVEQPKEEEQEVEVNNSGRAKRASMRKAAQNISSTLVRKTTTTNYQQKRKEETRSLSRASEDSHAGTSNLDKSEENQPEEDDEVVVVDDDEHNDGKQLTAERASEESMVVVVDDVEEKEQLGNAPTSVDVQLADEKEGGPDSIDSVHTEPSDLIFADDHERTVEKISKSFKDLLEHGEPLEEANPKADEHSANSSTLDETLKESEGKRDEEEEEKEAAIVTESLSPHPEPLIGQPNSTEDVEMKEDREEVVASIAVDEHEQNRAVSVEEEEEQQSKKRAQIPVEAWPAFPQFKKVDSNLMLCKEAESNECKSLQCECIPSSKERKKGLACAGDECLNRLLLMECGDECRSGKYCTNKRFQKMEYAQLEVFFTGPKGWGLRTRNDIQSGQFLIEYVGEVINSREMAKRIRRYGRDPTHQHHYLMALRSGAVIDATTHGNEARFINHSCEPNAVTQKWTVGRELRIGFFAVRPIRAGEEITFNYQFERYGKRAQKCFCESPSCTGFIGASKECGSDAEEEQNDSDSSQALSSSCSSGDEEDGASAVLGEQGGQLKSSGGGAGGSGSKFVPFFSLESKAAMALARKRMGAVGRKEMSKERWDQHQHRHGSGHGRRLKSAGGSGTGLDKLRPVELSLITDPTLREQAELNELLVRGTLRNRDQVLEFNRLMVRVDQKESRRRMVDFLLRIDDPNILRLFVANQGLALIRIWFVLPPFERRALQLQTQIARLLMRLPVSNKNQIDEVCIMSTLKQVLAMELPDKIVVKEVVGQLLDTVEELEVAEASATLRKAQADTGTMTTSVHGDQQMLVREFEVLKDLAMKLYEKWESLVDWEFRIPKKLVKTKLDKMDESRSRPRHEHRNRPEHQQHNHGRNKEEGGRSASSNRLEQRRGSFGSNFERPMGGGPRGHGGNGNQNKYRRFQRHYSKFLPAHFRRRFPKHFGGDNPFAREHNPFWGPEDDDEGNGGEQFSCGIGDEGKGKVDEAAAKWEVQEGQKEENGPNTSAYFDPNEPPPTFFNRPSVAHPPQHLANHPHHPHHPAWHPQMMMGGGGPGEQFMAYMGPNGRPQAGYGPFHGAPYYFPHGFMPHPGAAAAAFYNCHPANGLGMAAAIAGGGYYPAPPPPPPSEKPWMVALNQAQLKRQQEMENSGARSPEYSSNGGDQAGPGGGGDGTVKMEVVDEPESSSSGQNPPTEAAGDGKQKTAPADGTSGGKPPPKPPREKIKSSKDIQTEMLQRRLQSLRAVLGVKASPSQWPPESGLQKQGGSRDGSKKDSASSCTWSKSRSPSRERPGRDHRKEEDKSGTAAGAEHRRRHEREEQQRKERGGGRGEDGRRSSRDESRRDRSREGSGRGGSGRGSSRQQHVSERSRGESGRGSRESRRAGDGGRKHSKSPERGKQPGEEGRRKTSTESGREQQRNNSNSSTSEQHKEGSSTSNSKKYSSSSGTDRIRQQLVQKAIEEQQKRDEEKQLTPEELLQRERELKEKKAAISAITEQLKTFVQPPKQQQQQAIISGKSAAVAVSNVEMAQQQQQQAVQAGEVRKKKEQKEKQQKQRRLSASSISSSTSSLSSSDDSQSSSSSTTSSSSSSTSESSKRKKKQKQEKKQGEKEKKVPAHPVGQAGANAAIVPGKKKGGFISSTVSIAPPPAAATQPANAALSLQNVPKSSPLKMAPKIPMPSKIGCSSIAVAMEVDKAGHGEDEYEEEDSDGDEEGMQQPPQISVGILGDPNQLDVYIHQLKEFVFFMEKMRRDLHGPVPLPSQALSLLPAFNSQQKKNRKWRKMPLKRSATQMLAKQQQQAQAVLLQSSSLASSSQIDAGGKQNEGIGTTPGVPAKRARIELEPGEERGKEQNQMEQQQQQQGGSASPQPVGAVQADNMLEQHQKQQQQQHPFQLSAASASSSHSHSSNNTPPEDPRMISTSSSRPEDPRLAGSNGNVTRLAPVQHGTEEGGQQLPSVVKAEPVLGLEQEQNGQQQEHNMMDQTAAAPAQLGREQAGEQYQNQQQQQLASAESSTLPFVSSGPTSMATNAPGPMVPMPMMPLMSKSGLWFVARDADGTPYFYHRDTRETVWELPEGEELLVQPHGIGPGGEDMASGGGVQPGDERLQQLRSEFKRQVSALAGKCIESYRKRFFRSSYDYVNFLRKITHKVLENQENNKELLFSDQVQKNTRRLVEDYIKHFKSRELADCQKSLSPKCC